MYKKIINFDHKYYCYIYKIPNEIVLKIYDFLELDDKINISRTCKRYHTLLKKNSYNINIEDIIIFMIKNKKNESEDQKDNFKSIIYLYFSYIKDRNFIIENITINEIAELYSVAISIKDIKLNITHYTFGTGLTISYNELYNDRIGYIQNNKCFIKDILFCIDIICNFLKTNEKIKTIHKYEVDKYDIKKLYDYIKKSYIYIIEENEYREKYLK